MESSLEVLFTPADFAALQNRDLSQTVCVVFDILRATSSMVTALSHGATAIYPVREISEAVQLRQSHPGALLAGERHGVRILASQSGGVDFDLGNSPREFTCERVAGKEIIMTTTNGTRALQACRGARRIFAGSFLNLRHLCAALRELHPLQLLVICAGTFEEAAYEDTLAAGAICDELWNSFPPAQIADSAQMARQIYISDCSNLSEALSRSKNARRLLSLADLRDDVEWCFRRNTVSLIAELSHNAVRVK